MGQALRVIEQRHDTGIQIGAAADNGDLDAGAMQFGHVLANKAAQEIEQKRNFRRGPRPVFRTEGIDREVFDAEFGRRP